MSLLHKMLDVVSISNDSLLVEGPHGIGKSEMVAEWSEKQGYFCKALFGSQQEVGDLIGLPNIENNITNWAKPVWLSEMEEAYSNGSRCVLFLDELNRAQPDVQQAMLEVVLNKSIHTHKLPSETIVVSAINPSNGKYKTTKFDPALTNRFLHIKIDANATEWLDYAKRKDIHRTVMSFISKNEDKIFHEDQQSQQSATPRSWTMLSKNLKAYEESKIQNNEVLKNIICGKIGLAVGGQFFHYYLENSKLIEPEQIIDFVKEKQGKYKLTENTFISDVEDIAADMKHELLQDQDNITLQGLFSKVAKRYFDVGITGDELKNSHEKRVSVLPLSVLMYAINIELIASVLKQTKAENKKLFDTIVFSDNLFLSRRILQIKEGV